MPNTSADMNCSSLKTPSSGIFDTFSTFWQVKTTLIPSSNFSKKIQGESLLSVFSKSVTNDLYIKNQPRTAKSYIASVKSFLRFRNGVDISFEELTPKLISDYERYLKEQQICNNTISFYMRNLRAIYNRAVEESYTEQKHPFKKSIRRQW